MDFNLLTRSIVLSLLFNCLSYNKHSLYLIDQWHVVTYWKLIKHNYVYSYRIDRVNKMKIIIWNSDNFLSSINKKVENRFPSKFGDFIIRTCFLNIGLNYTKLLKALMSVYNSLMSEEYVWESAWNMGKSRITFLLWPWWATKKPCEIYMCEN